MTAELTTRTNWVPPQSLEAEQAVLGSMLIERQAVEIAAGKLKPTDFYREAHRAIFEAITWLDSKNEPIDTISVTEQLRRQDLLERIGGTGYLAQLENAVPSAANVEYYAEVVLEKSILRGLIDAANQTIALANGEYESIDEVVASAGKAFNSACERDMGERLTPMRQLVKEAYEQFEEAGQRPKGQLSGLPTGIPDLDYVMDGFQDGDVILICARPGVGKSAISINTFSFEALRHGKRVAVFSMEMSKGQLINRLLARCASVSSHALRTGTLDESDWRRVGNACDKASEYKLWIDDGFDQTPAKIRARLRQLERIDGKIDLIVIDYLLLMNSEVRREKEHSNVAANAKAIKQIAREFKAPVILLHQMNKGIDFRSDGRPVLGDAKEAGDADADVVMFLWKAKNQTGIAEGFEGIWLSIAKNRNGQNGGDIPLIFNQAILHFAQMDESQANSMTETQPSKVLPRRQQESAVESRQNPSPRSPYKDSPEVSTNGTQSGFDMDAWANSH